MTAINSAKRRKFFPTAIATLVTAVLFLASLFTQALGTQLTEFFKPAANWWMWILFVAFVFVVAAAAWDRWRAEASDSDQTAHSGQTQTGNRNASFGSGASGNITVTGDGNVIYQQPATNHQPPTTRQIRQINPPPRDFVGRKTELEELLADLQSGAVISGVQGQGGIGKTTLALKLAEDLGDKFTGAQIFLDLQGMSERPVKTTSAMEHVIRSFHPESGQLPDTVAALQPIYLSVLQAELSAGRPVLLLFDNAASRAQVEPLIPPAGCAMLVTSRAHFTLPGMKERNLEALPMADAQKLLLELCERCGVEAEELAKLCGRLPMALRLVGSFLRERRDYYVARYLEKLRAARLQQLPEVAASLQLSCEQLPKELLAHWRKLSVFPDSFDLKAAAAVLELDEDEALDALSELVRFSLLDWLDAEQRYTMHDLPRDYADSQLAEDERQKLKLNHAKYFCDVLAEAGALYEAGGEQVVKGLALFDRERANIESGHAWATSQSDVDSAALALCVLYPNAGTLILDLRQNPREQIDWLEIQLAVARILNRQDLEGDALNNLGGVYLHIGDMPKAIKFYEQYLAIAHKTGDQHRKGTALGNLGVAYANLGETRKAIEFYEQRIAISREIGDRRGEGSGLGNLGNAYADLGETRKAIEFYEQALVIDREIGDRRGEGIALGNLGLAYANLGEMRQAIEFYEQYLAIAREIGDRRGEGNALWNMALTLNMLSDRDAAIGCAEAALKIYEEIEDPTRTKVREQLAKWRGQPRSWWRRWIRRRFRLL